MGYSLKQSQTARPLLFKLRQSADHVSALTGASPTVLISKNGASFATPAGAVTEVGSGWYQVAANATDTNTLGALLLYATAGSADPTDEVFEIVAYDPDQVRVGASDGTGVTLAANQDVRNVLGTLPSVTLATSQPNYAPAKAGDEMSLTSTVLGQLFSDTDTADLVNAIIARVESDLDGADLSTAAIAVAVRNEILNRVLSGNHETAGSVGKVLQFLDATISSRATPAQVYDQSEDAITANLTGTIDAVGSIDALLTALTEVVASVTRFRASALSQAPSGGGGAGDATLAKQEEILDAIDAYFSQVLATVDGTADTIVGFPATLTIGNSYTTDGGNAIHVFIRDENDDPITSVGTHNFTDPDFSCDLIITNSGNAGRVRATVTYVDPGAAESYLKVEIPLSESSRAAAGAATMQCTLKWDGVAKTIATQTVTWVARI